MQTRPLLSSEPITVDINGWIDPVIARTAPLPRMAWAAGYSAVSQVGENFPMGRYGITWDKAPRQTKNLYF